MARFATKDHFASYNATAPIDASSGEQARHRLSPAGNRRISHALHMVAVTQIRDPHTQGRQYYERKHTAGKTPKEALRCLTRRLSDLVYRQLVTDQRGSRRADHLRPRGRRRLHPPHRPPPTPGRTTIQAPTPPGTGGFIAPDWKHDRLVGTEILDASTRLHQDLLEEVEING